MFYAEQYNRITNLGQFNEIPLTQESEILLQAAGEHALSPIPDHLRQDVYVWPNNMEPEITEVVDTPHVSYRKPSPANIFRLRVVDNDGYHDLIHCVPILD